jgi:hypothetical protein
MVRRIDKNLGRQFPGVQRDKLELLELFGSQIQIHTVKLFSGPPSVN